MNQPPAKTSKTVPLAIIAVVFLAVAVGLVVYFYFPTKTDAPVVNNTTNTAVNTNVATNTNSTIDTSDWLTYENEELGISFDYPVEWGEVQTQEIDNREKDKEAFSGQGFNISFSNYPSGSILFASADYKNFVTFHYNGNSDLSQECKTPGAIQDHSYCINKLVANQNTFDRIFFDAYECSPHFEREAWLNVNQNVYKGIRMSTEISTEGKWDCASNDQAEWDRVTDSELNRLIDRENLTMKEKNLLEAMDGFINSIKLFRL